MLSPNFDNDDDDDMVSQGGWWGEDNFREKSTDVSKKRERYREQK